MVYGVCGSRYVIRGRVSFSILPILPILSILSISSILPILPMKLILLLFISTTCFSQWHKIEGYRQDNDPWKMHFFDESNVLYINTHGGFSISNDAGDNWDHPYYPDDGPFFNDYVDFHGEVMYSLGGNFGESGNTIYKIWNYGLDFEIIGTVSHDDVSWTTEIICMLNDKVGITGKPWFNMNNPQQQGFKSYFTSDGGDTWYNRRTLYNTHILRYIFVDEQKIYVIHDYKISFTDNQAVSWNRLAINTNNEECFHVIDEENSYSAFGNKLFKTSDNWNSSDTLLYVEDESDYIIDIDFLEEGTLWALSRSGKVYNSNDSGENWTYTIFEIDDHDIEGLSINGIDKEKVMIKVKVDNDSINFYRNFIPVSVNKDQKIENRITRIGNELIFNSELMGNAIIKYYDLSSRRLKSYKSNLIIGNNSLPINDQKILFITINIQGKQYRQLVY